MRDAFRPGDRVDADPVFSEAKARTDAKELEVEHGGRPVRPRRVVSAEEERRLMQKLDRRIIPMVCWIYLMNFMDRGECCGRPCPPAALVANPEPAASRHRQCAPVRH